MGPFGTAADADPPIPVWIASAALRYPARDGDDDRKCVRCRVHRDRRRCPPPIATLITSFISPATGHSAPRARDRSILDGVLAERREQHRARIG